jgi:Septum formation/Domain of unknown function (DUF4190)
VTCRGQRASDPDTPRAALQFRGVSTPPGPRPGPPPLPEPPTDHPHEPSDERPHGESSNDQPSYGQPPYGQPSHDQPSYGQAEYGQAQYGQAQYGQAQYGYPEPGYAAYREGPYPQGRKPGTDGFAIAAFVLSLLGGVLLSVIFGILALRRIRRTGQGGRGLAIAALVISGVWVVLVGALIVVGLAGSAGRDQTGTVTKAGSVSADDLKQGDCLRTVPGDEEVTSVDVTPCTSAHRAEVYAVFDLPAGSYPGDAKVEKLADQGCAARTPDLTGSSTKNLEAAYLYPRRAQWQLGDRSVTCIVSSPTDLTSKLVP